MKKTLPRQLALALARDCEAQSDLVLQVAERSVDMAENTALQEVGQKLLADADRLRKQVEAAAVKLLPANASLLEIHEARRCQAVQVGLETYLPSWDLDAYYAGIPNVFLRSELFSTNDDHALLAEHVIMDLNGATITFTGRRLCQQDKHVYAAALRCYHAVPLAAGMKYREPISFYRFITEYLGVTYNAESHRMVRDGLVRLNEASLRVRSGRNDVSIPRLLTAHFNDAYVAGDLRTLASSDTLMLCVDDAVAPLYGPNSWTAIPAYVPRVTRGLVRWLGDFYTTHSKSCPLSVARLHVLSGAAAKNKPLSEFRSDLKETLTRMMGPKHTVRVADFIYRKDDDTVLVRLASWGSKHSTGRQEK